MTAHRPAAGREMGECVIQSCAFLTRFNWGAFPSSKACHTCLRSERQGNCGSDNYEYTGGLQHWVYFGGRAEERLYNGTIVDLRRCLTPKRIVMVGDSLTRQQDRALRCLLPEVGMDSAWVGSNLTYINCPYLIQEGKNLSDILHWPMSQLCAPLETVLQHPINAIDVLQLNVGQWVDEAKLGMLGVKWADAFQAKIVQHTLARLHKLLSRRSSPTHVLFRTTASRFFRDGDFNTKPRGWCGCKGLTGNPGRCRPTIAAHPNALAIYADFNPISRVLPEMNQLLVQLFCAAKSNASRQVFEILNTAKLSLAREDASFDCSHFCLPGVPDAWNLMLLNRVCSLDLVL